MPQPFDIVVVDSSSIILLSKIDELEILKLVFRHVAITSIISKELNIPLPDWITLRDPINKNTQKLLEIELDQGEASAIAVCLEFENSLLIVDDLKARRLASILDLNFTGTFGLFLRAKQLGVIQSVKPILDKIAHTNFRISASIIQLLLKEAGEN